MTEEHNKPKILVIDDEQGIRDLLMDEFGLHGYSVDAAENGEEGLEKLKDKGYDVVITDIKMPRMDGTQVLKCIKSISPDTEVILVTGYASIENAVRAMKDGAYDFIEKPFNFEELQALVEKAYEKRELKTLLAQYASGFKELWDNAPVAYHTLDTSGMITRVNRTELNLLGYTLKEMVGKPIFDFIVADQREEARNRFKQKMLDKNPSKSETRIYVKKTGEKVYVSIDDAVDRDAYGKVTGIRTTMVDITGRKNSELELKQSNEKLQKAFESIIQVLGKIVEMRDPYTAGHQKRVAQLACAIARELNLSEDQVSGIHIASVIHDIGKICVPSEILCKPGKLTEIEFGMIKTHPKVSYDILNMVAFPWPIADIVIQHHERMDSSGYPMGLRGEEIVIEARILSVADVVEAITFHRPYRSAVGIDKALEEISSGKGRLYDDKVADACLKVFKERGFQFEQ